MPVILKEKTRCLMRKYHYHFNGLRDDDDLFFVLV